MTCCVPARAGVTWVCSVDAADLDYVVQVGDESPTYVHGRKREGTKPKGVVCSCLGPRHDKGERKLGLHGVCGYDAHIMACLSGNESPASGTQSMVEHGWMDLTWLTGG